jgi:sterol desaturase/sphingolipid hydroxylase (fatty acid hydroxylase superfamily)
VRHSFGWIGRYLIISPNGHRIHHSLDEKHHNKNFGAMFTWWDQLFGTFYLSDDTVEIGIDDNAYNSKGFWFDTFNGMRSFFGSMFSVKR